MKALVAFWNIFKKDVDNYYLKPPNISWGLVFPLSWALMQLMRSQGEREIIQLLPGLTALSILFGTTSMLAVTITFERRTRSFERLLLAPLKLGTLVAAKLSGAVLFGMVNSSVPLLLAAFFVNLRGVKWGTALLASFLIALTSALMGLLIAVSAQEVFEAQTLSNFFRFPMLFLCGLFFPLQQLPVFLKPISYCLPLTYGTDALKSAFGSNSLFNPSLSLLVLLFFCVLLFYWSQRSINKKWIS